MANGQIASNGTYSSLKYTGSAIASRFSATTVNQELIIFKDKTDNDNVTCNSINVTAGTQDLFFSILPSKANIAPTELSEFDFTDSFVFFVEAESSITVSGVSMGGVKFSNTSGAQYYITGLSY